MDFGERLVKARKTLDYNQNDFAKKLEIASQSLGRYEKNKVKPSIEFIHKLTDVFNINSNWLISGKGSILLNIEDIDYRMELNKILDNLSTEKIKSIYELIKISD